MGSLEDARKQSERIKKAVQGTVARIENMKAQIAELQRQLALKDAEIHALREQLAYEQAWHEIHEQKPKFPLHYPEGVRTWR